MTWNICFALKEVEVVELCGTDEGSKIAVDQRSGNCTLLSMISSSSADYDS